jgi:hypothetical protein
MNGAINAENGLSRIGLAAPREFPLQYMTEGASSASKMTARAVAEVGQSGYRIGTKGQATRTAKTSWRWIT